MLDDTKEITLENSLHCSKQMDKCQIEMKLFFYLFQKVKEIVFGSANIPPPVEWLKQGLVICNFLHYCCKTPLNNVRLAGHMLPAKHLIAAREHLIGSLNAVFRKCVASFVYGEFK